MTDLRFDTAAKLHRTFLFRGFLLTDSAEQEAAITNVRVTSNVTIVGVSYKIIPPMNTRTMQGSRYVR
jgi:hypothetical protein